jgi:hypothetical protein
MVGNTGNKNAQGWAKIAAAIQARFPAPVAKRLTKKNVLAGAAAGILFIVGCAWSISSHRDRTLVTAIENAASATLGIEVTVDSINRLPSENAVILSGIGIRDPQGYAKPVLVIGTLTAIIDPTAPDGLLVLQRVTAENIHINLEIESRGTTLTTLQQTLHRMASDQPGSGADIGSHVVIRDLRMVGAFVTPFSKIARLPATPVFLPGIELKNVGVGPDNAVTGVTASAAIAMAVDRMTALVVAKAVKTGFFNGIFEAPLNAIQQSTGVDTSAASKTAYDSNASWHESRKKNALQHQ